MGHTCGKRRRRRASQNDRGHTFIEVMVAIAILSLVMVAVTQVSFNTPRVVAVDTIERHLDATSAQFVSVAFARDVQGAAHLGSTDCGNGTHGTELVTLRASSDGSLVSYRDRVSSGAHELLRTECDASGGLLDARVLLDGLAGAPSVECRPTACSPTGTPPRVVTLTVSRTAEFAFALDGARRSSAEAVIGPVLPAELFAIGGGNPLAVGGNGHLVVDGNAFINSAVPAAVTMSGANARMTVTGDFKILAGGGCSGCSAVKNQPFPPGSYPAPLPDPLAYLPVPNETGMAAGSCVAQVCTPGVYSHKLNLAGNATLQPGVYVLRKGFSISGNGSITGHGVFLFNGCGVGAPVGCANSEGPFSVSGGSRVDLSPMTTGTYAGILLFQSRTNVSSVSISGGANLMLYRGVLYAPMSSQVALGAGGGGLQLGAVVGRSLVVTGNGTVQIDGT